MVGGTAELAGWEVVGRGRPGSPSRQSGGGDAGRSTDRGAAPEEGAAAPAVPTLLIEWHEKNLLP